MGGFLSGRAAMWDSHREFILFCAHSLFVPNSGPIPGDYQGGEEGREGFSGF